MLLPREQRRQGKGGGYGLSDVNSTCGSALMLVSGASRLVGSREPDIAALLTKRESSARDHSSTACWMRGAGRGLQRGSHRVRYQCQSKRDLDELL